MKIYGKIQEESLSISYDEDARQSAAIMISYVCYWMNPALIRISPKEAFKLAELLRAKAEEWIADNPEEEFR